MLESVEVGMHTDLESVKWIAPDKANPLPLADMATVRTAILVALVPMATLLQPSCPASLSSNAFLKAASRSSLPVGSATACSRHSMFAVSLVNAQ